MRKTAKAIITKLDCGCTHNGYGERCGEWTERCPPHKVEHDEIHARATADYRRSIAAMSNEDLR